MKLSYEQALELLQLDGEESFRDFLDHDWLDELIDTGSVTVVSSAGKEVVVSLRFDYEQPKRPMYAVICKQCGPQELDDEEYTRQISNPDTLWVCPKCRDAANWDDDCLATNPDNEGLGEFMNNGDPYKYEVTHLNVAAGAETDTNVVDRKEFSFQDLFGLTDWDDHELIAIAHLEPDQTLDLEGIHVRIRRVS